jgi:hypothetical protein
MPFGIVFFVPPSGESALNPLHYFGQRLSGSGLNEKMDVVVHNGKVP